MALQQDNLDLETINPLNDTVLEVFEPLYRVEIITDSIILEQLPNFFHSNYTVGMPVHESTTQMDNWMIMVLLILIFISGLVFTYFRKEYFTIVTSFFRREGISKLAEEDHAMHKRTVGLIMIIALFATTLFAYQVLDYFGILRAFLPIIPLFLQVLFLIAGIFGFKILIIRMLGNIFQANAETDMYLTSSMVLSSILGMILMPVNVLIAFSAEPTTSYGLFIGIALFTFIYLFSLLSGAFFARRHRELSIFHIFLYLCTLEILPVIVIAKAILSIA